MHMGNATFHVAHEFHPDALQNILLIKRLYVYADIPSLRSLMSLNTVPFVLANVSIVLPQ